MDSLSKFVIPCIIFILTLAFGFWLSSAGKPYNGILFNVHKLIALATVIVTAIKILDIVKGVEIQFLPMILLVVTGLCIVALFATGALMSIGKLNFEVALTVHWVAPILMTITILMSIFLIRGIKL